ncbi:MAG: hypothetical protein AAGM84_06900 [Pseudomonadota bacterium]
MTSITLGKAKIQPRHILRSGEFQRHAVVDLPAPKLFPFGHEGEQYTGEGRGENYQMYHAIDEAFRKSNYNWDCAKQDGRPKPFGVKGEIEPRLLFFAPLNEPSVLSGKTKADAVAEWREAQADMVTEALTRTGFKSIAELDAAMTKIFGKAKVDIDLAALVAKNEPMKSYRIEVVIEYEAFTLMAHGVARFILLLPGRYTVDGSQTGICVLDRETDTIAKIDTTETPFGFYDVGLIGSGSKAAGDLRKAWRARLAKRNASILKRTREKQADLKEAIKKVGG